MAENRRESDDSVIDVEAADFKERCEKSKVPVDLPLRFTDLWRFLKRPFPCANSTPARRTSPGLLPQVF